jgi:hypothetical protein
LHSLSVGLLIVFLICVRHACFIVFILNLLKSIKRFSRTRTIRQKLLFPLLWIIFTSLSFVLLLLTLLMFPHVSFLKLLFLFHFFKLILSFFLLFFHAQYYGLFMLHS